MKETQNPNDKVAVSGVPGDDGDARKESDGGDDRRTFIRRLVSGSLVVGGVGAAVLPTAEVVAAPQLVPSRAAIAPRAKPVLKVTFDRKRPPSLQDLIEVIEQATGRLGCTGCGFDGIDLRLVLDEVVGPQPDPWVGEIQDQVAF